LARKRVVSRPLVAKAVRRAGSSQKRQTTALGFLILAPPQPPLPTSGRSGSAKAPFFIKSAVPKPPMRPMAMAAKALKRAKPSPSVPRVSTNIEGSMRGEASQKAMTAGNGTPMTSRAAMSGMTPQEQKGEKAPTMLATTIIGRSRPVKALAMRLSAPEALA
jgi:hypothetical protein